MPLFFLLVALGLLYYLGSLLAWHTDRTQGATCSRCETPKAHTEMYDAATCLVCHAAGEREWHDFVARKREKARRQHQADARTERLASSSSSSFSKGRIL